MQTVNVSSSCSKIALVLAMGSALGLTSGLAADPLDSLRTNSPFGSVKSVQANDAGNQPLEFRGILEENGQQLFSIFDTATKRSRWVGLNDTTSDVVLKSYDADAHTVSVEQNGRALSLTLKSGPRVVQNMPPPPPMGMQPGATVLPGQIQPNGMGKGPEAQRLQQIAEEIRRRRALRQQSPQMQMPVPNTVPGSGGPMPTPNSAAGSGGPMPLPGSGSGSGPMPMPNAGSSTSMPNLPPKS